MHTHMKSRWLMVAALPLLAAPWSWAQKAGDPAGQDSSSRGSNGQESNSQESNGRKGRLTRVRNDSRADEQRQDTGRDEGERFDREAWKKRLATGDLEERERAFDKLADLAGSDGEARKALEEWSKDEKNADLAWTSRLALREVDRREANGSPWHAWKLGGHPGGSWLGQDFNLEDFARRFDDLDSMFGDLRGQWEGMLEALPAPSSGSASSSESINLQTGPDGVTCEVTRDVDGKKESHTYQAKNMDELLEANPELREKLGGGMRFQMFGGPMSGHVTVPPRVLRIGPRHGLFHDPDQASPGGEPRTDRLGIMCSEVDEEHAGDLGLEAGVGLRVESIQPGTIASLLGLRRGDVVVEVNGATVRGTGDVKKALQERAADADVAVVVVGSDGHRRTLTWKPEPAVEKPQQKQEKKSGSRDL